ncbi:hypothetical protein M7I_5329 [Glarea lozoyensis 74030]|uniref:Yeast cell wall synthesis Kre9/Knh1-like N-terminal domain-containing protein n=1 Tax=Glarea lozoyensis (strain ATCC 74030 / MF5533) TaxID=1104152 RepID=H0ERL0_GLAL7|nr:hypothetical protein M7I_5329 [Glarea lozoyensis 74030]
MQFSTALIAAVAFGFANAVSFTNSAFNGITAGQPIELTWTDASGPVTITLKNGASTDLQTVSVVASGQTGSSFTWSVPSTLTQDTYALEITDSSATPNYSPQFELIGGAPATSSAASSISASASSASSSVASSISSVTSSLSSVASSISSSLSTATASSTTSSDASSTTAATNGTTTTGSSTSTPILSFN